MFLGKKDHGVGLRVYSIEDSAILADTSLAASVATDDVIGGGATRQSKRTTLTGVTQLVTLSLSCSRQLLGARCTRSSAEQPMCTVREWVSMQGQCFTDDHKVLAVRVPSCLSELMCLRHIDRLLLRPLKSCGGVEPPSSGNLASV